MNTIVPLPASQKAAMMDYMYPNKCVDLENESFSASETLVYYQSDQKRAEHEPSVGMILGCRDRHPGRINPGTLCKVRRMVVGTSAVAVIGAARYREHRGLAVFKNNPSVYPEAKELFGTETFDVLTASQLEQSAKVMVLDPASWMAVREKAHRRRKSDKDLTMAAMGGLDDNEWYYSLGSVIGEEMDYKYPLENSRIAPNASMAPTLYTNFMLKKAAVTKFVASIMQPYTDGHRYPPVLMETEVNKTYMLNGVLKIVKVVRVRQEPGSLKPHTLSIPFDVANDMLLTCLGLPDVEGVKWVWTGKKLRSRTVVELLAGLRWWVREYPDLPGSPRSVVTHAMFLAWFVLSYDPVTETLTIKLDREREIDGKLCTFKLRDILNNDLKLVTYEVVDPANESLGSVTMPEEFNLFTLRTAFIPTALKTRPAFLDGVSDGYGPFWWFKFLFDRCAPNQERNKIASEVYPEPRIIRLLSPVPAAPVQAEGSTAGDADAASADSTQQLPPAAGAGVGRAAAAAVQPLDFTAAAAEEEEEEGEEQQPSAVDTTASVIASAVAVQYQAKRRRTNPPPDIPVEAAPATSSSAAGGNNTTSDEEESSDGSM